LLFASITRIATAGRLMATQYRAAAAVALA
jgi:hypothetical protein